MSNASTLDDITLIKYFAKGESESFSSQNLRIESSWNAIQLTTIKGEVIGVLKGPKQLRSILIKSESKYWELINQILLENNFIPLGKSEQQSTFFEYEQNEVPAGYKVNYTETRVLWKTWWPKQRVKKDYEIRLDVLVLKDKKWYPIQNIILDNGIFFIKTLIGEIKATSIDKVVWLNQSSKETIQNTNIDTLSSPKPLENPDFIVNEIDDKNIINYQEVEKDVIVPAKVESKLEVDPQLERFSMQLKNQALKTLANYLANGETEIQTEIIKDAQGNITSTKIITIKKPCPQWVIEHLLK